MSATTSLNVPQARIALIVSMRIKAEHFTECLEACETIQVPSALVTLLGTIHALEQAARKAGASAPSWAYRSRVKAFAKGSNAKCQQPKEFKQLINSDDPFHARGLGIRLD